MKDEDKNYNLEEDDEDEDFMIGGTNDDQIGRAHV